jgi:hypothetical protein
MPLVSSANLVLSATVSGNNMPGTRDGNGRCGATPRFEDMALRSRNTQGFPESFLDVDVPSPPPSVRRKRSGVTDEHHGVRYPPGLP